MAKSKQRTPNMLLIIPPEVVHEEDKIDGLVRYEGNTMRRGGDDEEYFRPLKAIIFNYSAYEDAIIELLDAGLNPEDFTLT